MIAQEKERIECAIRHIQTAVDVDPWAVEIAVEAMKAQLSAEVTTSDLISRQAAIDVCDNATDLWHGQLGEGIVIAVKKKIEELPPAQPEVLACGEGVLNAQPESHWIPVSERLPKVGHSVLFSRRSMDTREGCLQADGKWWQYRWNEILNADQVTAWMPLPEPYRAERRADDKTNKGSPC